MPSLPIKAAGALAAAYLLIPAMATAAPPAAQDTFLIPERVISLSGSTDKAKDLVAILYNRQELHHSDPSAPRFLFVDSKGRVALGIGGYVKGSVQYDFRGSINDGSSFTTYDIPVPSDPAQREAFFANANHSTLFLQMLGRTDHFGTYEMYIQTNFSGGGPGAYGLKLKQAYLRLGYVTAGLTNSTFVDGAAGTPTIDDQGPSGEVGAKNILLQYRPRLSEHITAAVSVENPSASYTLDDNVKAISQRVPDIPVFIQYAWGGGESHVRLSALLRNLSYRDLVAGTNRFATGWAAQLSGAISFAPAFRLYYQGAYGHGYGRYVNDLAEADADLIPCAGKAGRMHAPAMSNFELGLQYNFSPKAYIAGAYSQAHLYEATHLGPDTYKRGQYVTVSGFYNIISDFTIGLEYLHGSRTNVDHSHGSANRVMGMMKLSF
jgi:hypothetical protein